MKRTRFFVTKAVGKRISRIVCITLCGTLLAGLVFFGAAWGVSQWVFSQTADRIYDSCEALVASKPEPFDCVLVLGCRVYDDGRLSPMLADRMTVAIDLMKSDISSKLLVSGDHATDAYNEVGAMKSYAVANGIDSSAVFEDHDGYSTYDSIARLKAVYGAKRVVIVTQKYHLHRALYLAEALGIEAVGVSADLQTYAKQAQYDFREIFARCKDVYLGFRKPSPAGDLAPIALNGNGDATACSRPVKPIG